MGAGDRCRKVFYVFDSGVGSVGAFGNYWKSFGLMEKLLEIEKRNVEFSTIFINS